MKLLDRMNNYINETEYKIIIKNNMVNIINYNKILDFNATKISVGHSKGITDIIGKNLVVNKMLNDEILITGIITNINLKGEL